MASTIEGDVYYTGNVRFAGTVGFPPNALGNASVNASDPIQAVNLQHRFAPKLSQVYGTAAVAERRVVHRARAAGTVADFFAGLTVACVGAATVTVDLLKNGTTVLSAPVTLTSATAAFGSASASVTVPAYAAGDVFEISVTVAAGGGTLGQGVFGRPTLTEGA